MQEYVVDHVIDCSPERYWALWLDPDWSERFLIEGLGYLGCDIEPVRSQGDAQLRDMVVTPRVPIPKALRRAVGERLTYTERGRLEGGVWRYDLSMAAFSAFSGRGEVRLAALPDNRCTRTTRMSFSVKLPMLGKRIEATAFDNAKVELDRGAAFINGWLAANA